MSSVRSRFPADTRARIPFALLGVLLLASSVAYGAGIASQGPTEIDRSVDRALERADGDADAAVRTAVHSAARDTAREPVTRSVDPGVDAVRPESAFVDALRIRIGLAAAERLPDADATVGGVTATPRLDAHGENSTGYLTGLRQRVRVAGVANGTALQVTVENVTVVAERDGERLTTQTRNVTVTVATPVLAAHERTERFETRLNRGPIEGDGLGRQLTARLYPVVWARGYGQYAGAPIQNVLANRHVELSTNTGILAVQRSTFGAADARARSGVRTATAHTGLEDLLAPTELEGDRWSDLLFDRTGTDPRPVVPAPGAADTGERPGRPDQTKQADQPISPSSVAGNASVPSHNGTHSVDVGHTADVAFLDTLERIDEVVQGVYRVDGERSVRVVELDSGRLPAPTPPAAPPPEPTPSEDANTTAGADIPEWSLVSQERDTTHTVLDRTQRRTATEATATVTVEQRATVVRTWVAGEATRRTTAADSRTFRVRIDVSAAHAPADPAPEREIVAPFDDPVLRGAGETAVERLVDDDGGFDGIAVRAVRNATGGDIDRDVTSGATRNERVIVAAEPPSNLEEQVATELQSLRESVRTISVDAERGGIATGAAAPETALRRTVGDRRTALVNAPRRYDTPDERAVTAARTAYIEDVQRELDRRAVRETETRSAFGEALSGVGAPDSDRLEGIRQRVDTPGGSAGGLSVANSAPDPEPVGNDGPGGGVVFEPVGSPGYLPRTPIDSSHARTVEDGSGPRDPGEETPLATRNVNYFTLPHGEVADGIVDRVLGEGRTVTLDRAGRTLAATNETLERVSDPELRALRTELAGEVEAGMDGVHREVDTVLREHTDLSARDRRTAIETADRRYDGLGERAIAVGNGSYADSVATAAANRGDAGDKTAPAGDALDSADADELAVRLRVATLNAADREVAAIPDDPVTDAAARTRAIARGELSDALEDGLEAGTDRAREHWGNEVIAATPAGLPVAPVPGYWYATTNVWRVQIEGTYPRFVVRASGGTAHEGSLEYVREAGVVTVEADGESVTLGETEPVAFETETAVAIAVPPGGGGVGDVDGVADERSPGWDSDR